jgi:hypothetical protein
MISRNFIGNLHSSIPLWRHASAGEQDVCPLREIIEIRAGFATIFMMASSDRLGHRIPPWFRIKDTGETRETLVIRITY